MEPAFGYSWLPKELMDAQRIDNGVLNATLDILAITPVGLIGWGDLARSIIKQAHEMFDSDPFKYGAWYVVRGEYGGWFCHPFGIGAEFRDHFRCDIDAELNCWIFSVLC
jgi:hypothetical protein